MAIHIHDRGGNAGSTITLTDALPEPATGTTGGNYTTYHLSYRWIIRAKMGRLVSHFHETDKRQCADTLNRPGHKAGISGDGAGDFFGPRFFKSACQ
jgi:hypothetical protein